MDLAEPILTDRGLELVDVECRREARGQIVRVLVDREGGVDLESLAKLSRELSDHLDVGDVIEGAYTLEVSSPGINRPLRTADQFRRYVGKKVRVRTWAPVGGRRNFTGRLADVSDLAVRVEVEGGDEISIPFPEIERANYEHEFSAEDFGRRGPAGSPGGRSQ